MDPNGQRFKAVEHGDKIDAAREDLEWTIENGAIVRRWPDIITDAIRIEELPSLITATESKILDLEKRLATLRDYAARATKLSAMPEAERIIKVKAEKKK